MNNMGILIEDINLVDDATATGGKANSEETLADFIANTMIPGKLTTLADLNKELAECGIEPITPEQIEIKGVFWGDDDYEQRV